MKTSPLCQLLLFACLLSALSSVSISAEPIRLASENWDRLCPAGKEFDAIYGDFVLANDELVAIIGNTLDGRHANLTVKNVAGSLIDFTFRKHSNDQLSAFYPGAGRCDYRSAELVGEGNEQSLVVKAAAGMKKPEVTTSYRLATKPLRMIITTEYRNASEEPLTVELVDAIRADKGFQLGSDEALNLFWVYDEYWDQAYGVVAADRQVVADANSGRPIIRYAKEAKSEVTVAPGESYQLVRSLIPGRNQLDILAGAHQIAGHEMQSFKLDVVDSAGPVSRAQVSLMQGEDKYGTGTTTAAGILEFTLPEGNYRAQVLALGRPAVYFDLKPAEQSEYEVTLEPTGYVVAEIVDGDGKPVPCKVEFIGMDDTSTPDFGPDTAEHAVKNLYYSHDGKFKQELGPGKYSVIISHGPEYDAVFTEIEVKRGEATPLTGKLVHSVNTKGWISSDFHSHSSPSGDNVSSQLGRVLNLLSEHIEFAPCTEHARISSYVPHLKMLGVENLMATCSGMELTGTPLPLNHQNSFPLIEKPRTQNGGGPETDANPIVQIERLALWDNGSDKLVQQNHPHLYQMLGDKDIDGKADGGFEAMFGFMDVVEVHPPGTIFEPQKPSEDLRATPNRMHAWMQLLNLGYRIPGVVNTDAHYNFHGSGGLRNYIRGDDDPAKVQIAELVHASEHGQLILTNGPYLQVELTVDEEKEKVAHEVGEEVQAPAGKVHMLVTVQCANWLDVNRVQVFVNGRADESLNFTRKTTPDRFSNGVEKFRYEFPIVLEHDAHLIVATAGEGLKLGHVAGPSDGKLMPVAVSNPIFVDIDGDGFKPNGDLLGIPLPIGPDHKPSLNQRHPHRHGHGHGHDHDHDHDHQHEHKPKQQKGGTQK
jgi:hypothetical protein